MTRKGREGRKRRKRERERRGRERVREIEREGGRVRSFLDLQIIPFIGQC